MDRIEEIRERYTEFMNNQVTWLPIPMNREDLIYIFSLLEQTEAYYQKAHQSWEQAEARVAELNTELTYRESYIVELKEQLRLANIDCFNIESRLAAAREGLERINQLAFEVITERNNGRDVRLSEHDLYNTTKQTLEKMG